MNGFPLRGGIVLARKEFLSWWWCTGRQDYNIDQLELVFLGCVAGCCHRKLVPDHCQHQNLVLENRTLLYDTCMGETNETAINEDNQRSSSVLHQQLFR